MPHVGGAEGQLLEEDGARVLQARLVRPAKVEVEADVCVLAVLQGAEGGGQVCASTAEQQCDRQRSVRQLWF